METTFEHNNARIAYDFTPSLGPTKHLLVLVNGYGRTRSDFRALRKRLESLTPHVATLALDNRYCGQTQIITPEDPVQASSHLIHNMALDVLALTAFYLKKLNIDSFSLLGISMGGMIVQTAASLPHQGVLENLFLVSTTAGGVGRTWPGHRTSSSGIEYKNLNTDLESTRKNMERYFGERFLKSSPLVFDMLCKNMLKASQGAQNQDHAKVQFYAGLHFDGVSQLGSVKANKTIVFSGLQDHIIPKENADFLKNHIAGSHLILYPEVGHLILIEEPQQFADDLSRHL